MIKHIKTFAILTLFLSFSAGAFSQNYPDTIQIIKKVFLFRNSPVKPRQLVEIMESNTAACNEMKAARRNYILGNIIGSFGGCMFGWPLGVVAAGWEFNVPFFATGVLISAVSLPISLSYIKRAKKAVKIYNDSVVNSFVSKDNSEDNIVQEKNRTGKITENIFYYSSHSKMTTELCLYVNGEKKACLTPGEYYKLEWPWDGELTSLELTSENGSHAVTFELHMHDDQLFLFKFKKNQQFFIDQVNEDTKKGIIRSFKEDQQVK